MNTDSTTSCSSLPQSWRTLKMTKPWFFDNIHGQEQDLYTISNWTCNMVNSLAYKEFHAELNKEEVDYDATNLTNLTPGTPRNNATGTGANNFSINEIYQGDSQKPQPKPLLINLSHELPGNMLKKCRSLPEASEVTVVTD